MKTRRCPLCEKGKVSPLASQEPMPFRHVACLKPAWPVRVPTCDRCHERFFDTATARSLDEALEAALATLNRTIVEGAIERLASVHTEREWEKRLGLSPGYLSRLRAGKESSVALTALLGLLSRSPERQWKHLEQLWSSPRERGDSRSASWSEPPFPAFR